MVSLNIQRLTPFDPSGLANELIAIVGYTKNIKATL